jgi:hypothetical protein
MFSFNERQLGNNMSCRSEVGKVKILLLDNDDTTEVEHLPQLPKVKGSGPAIVATKRERDFYWQMEEADR